MTDVPPSSPIIVGYDGSPAAGAALRFAKALGATAGDEVIAAAVHPAVPPVFSLGASAGADAEMTEALRAEALEVLHRLRDEDVRTEAVAGDSPAEGLHRLAQLRHAGLIAVGVTHRAALGRLLVGGVGDRLLHGASCPVAVVPAGWDGQGFSTVGVGFDGRPESWTALRAAHALASRLGAELEVVGVYEPAPYLWLTTPAPTPPPWDVDDLRTRFDRSLTDAIAELAPAVPSRVRAVSGLAGPALVEAAHGMDVLVTGSRGYGPLGSVLLGSVSRYVADHARCPLLVVPRGTVPDRG
jgi:nucleotide-binding universal stress UspA family protein